MNTQPHTPEHEPVPEHAPVLTLIKQIKENRVNPVVLSAEDRLRCVELLWSEGYGVAEIAQILQCSERTIYRDRDALRAAHALHVHPEFAPQMAGELVRQANTSVNRLRRIAREPGASAMERTIAETSAFKVYAEMITKLQSMGYLPRVPTGVVAQVVNGGEAIASYDELARRLEEIGAIDRELGLQDPERQERRMTLLEFVHRGRTEVEVERMRQARPVEN